jgi:hypothetical protein
LKFPGEKVKIRASSTTPLKGMSGPP